MKKADKNEMLLIVALGKTFNGTPLNSSECNVICDMSMVEIITALDVNETQAGTLYKWACACKEERSVSDEEDNC